MFRTIRFVVVDVEGKQQSELIRAARDNDDKLTPGKRRDKQRYYQRLTAQQIHRHEGQFGEITMDESAQIWLFAAPTTSEPHDEAFREIYAEGADGYIFVVNCAQSETFPETKSLIQMFLEYAAVPYLVAANGLYASGQPPYDLHAELSLPDDIDLVPCNTSDPVSAFEVVEIAFKTLKSNTRQ
jgi:hypothetical protein